MRTAATLVLGEGSAIAGTLVVSNLVYPQFRAKPGVCGLDIRPGRRRDIFHLQSVGDEGSESPTIDQANNKITGMNFDALPANVAAAGDGACGRARTAESD